MKGMMAFYQLFPVIGLRETRTATVFGRDSSLPDDSYGFIELYCVDPACDCRRVMINVLAEKQRTHLATINHAFAPPADDDPVQEQTFLDPLNVQSRWSGALLGLFKEMLLDEAYRERLDRHYRMVKDALRDPAHPIHQVISGSRRPSAPRHKTYAQVEPRALPLQQQFGAKSDSGEGSSIALGGLKLTNRKVNR